VWPSGRSIEEIAADADRVWQSSQSVAENVKHGAVRKPRPRLAPSQLAGASQSPMPATLAPQPATLAKQAPAGEEWLHEIKHDGYRMLCRVEEGEGRIVSRNGRDWTANFPAIARAAARLPVKSAWIDGEVVAVQSDGRSSFQALQNALSEPDAGKLQYYAFDLLYLDGCDLRKVPLIERKRLLEKLLGSSSGIVVRNNSRRGHVAVQRLQTRADSGMMSACCSRRERSSGWPRTS